MPKFPLPLEELLRVPNPLVIGKYIDFVNKKNKGGPTCTSQTVVNEFCKIIGIILKTKTTLTPKNIMDLANEMNAIALTGNWGPSQREWAINRLIDLFGGKPLQPNEVKKTRNWFTPSGASLTKATMEATAVAGGDYTIRSFKDTSKPVKQFTTNPTEKQQLIHSNTFYPFDSSTTVTAIERKQCGTCWMCGLPIYVYKLNASNSKTYYFGCGQDEHVLPPGWGNIIGVLWSNLKDQLQYNVNARGSLAPSHAWCNQLKNDELLIKLPYFNANKKYVSFSINDNGFARFMDKGIDWLTNGNKIIDHNTFYKELSNQLKVDNLDTPNATTFMTNMTTIMKIHLNTLIGDLGNVVSSISTTTGTNDYQIFMLRTTLCLAYMCNKIRTKRGGSQSGGDEDGEGDGDLLIANVYYQGAVFDEQVILDNFDDEIIDEMSDEMPVKETERVLLDNMWPKCAETKNVEDFIILGFIVEHFTLSIYNPKHIAIQRYYQHDSADEKFIKILVDRNITPYSFPYDFDLFDVDQLPTSHPIPSIPSPPPPSPARSHSERSSLKKGLDADETRRKREATTVQLRKDKKEDSLQKWRRDRLEPLPNAPSEEMEFGGGKHKSRKYKSQKYKSRKHKSRKHKSQKYKTRKHKSRKHKTQKRRKHKSRKHKSRKHK